MACTLQRQRAPEVLQDGAQVPDHSGILHLLLVRDGGPAPGTATLTLFALSGSRGVVSFGDRAPDLEPVLAYFSALKRHATRAAR